MEPEKRKGKKSGKDAKNFLMTVVGGIVVFVITTGQLPKLFSPPEDTPAVESTPIITTPSPEITPAPTYNPTPTPTPVPAVVPNQNPPSYTYPQSTPSPEPDSFGGGTNTGDFQPVDPSTGIYGGGDNSPYSDPYFSGNADAGGGANADDVSGDSGQDSISGIVYEP